mmetsp:Transcript_21452/g.37943  ORF Transcript_21452/g.37943 Transcript_21452/m.37943 type:complete len:287 (-) Transcript_21452:418-1278(-)
MIKSSDSCISEGTGVELLANAGLLFSSRFPEDEAAPASLENSISHPFSSSFLSSIPSKRCSLSRRATRSASFSFWDLSSSVSHFAYMDSRCSLWSSTRCICAERLRYSSCNLEIYFSTPSFSNTVSTVSRNATMVRSFSSFIRRNSASSSRSTFLAPLPSTRREHASFASASFSAKTSFWPSLTKSRGVCPLSSVASILAPNSTRATAGSRFPASQASCSGVWLELFTRFTSAPASASSAITSRGWPNEAAQCSTEDFLGVPSSESGLTPPCKRLRIMGTLPDATT